MKKNIYLFIALIFTFVIAGCDQSSEVQTLAGYIFIEDNMLYFDEVEIITKEDEDRIKELNLRESNDFPSGYAIYNPEVESVSYELMQDTKYIFTDYHLLFVKEANGNRIYETTIKQEFIDGSSYQHIPLEEQKIPYFIGVQDGKVISIKEEFIYTQ